MLTWGGEEGEEGEGERGRGGREGEGERGRRRCIEGVECDSSGGAHLVSFAPRYSRPISGVPYCTCWGGVCKTNIIH